MNWLRQPDMVVGNFIPKWRNILNSSKKSQWVTYCNAKMPRLLNVPGFDGILIHPGNSAKDSDGCILPGKNDKKGWVSNSTETFKKLYTKMKEAIKIGEKLYITIK